MTANKLVQLLIEKNLRITTAESCTGGMIASEIVSVTDASKVFDAGFVTYADFAKENMINVPGELIKKFGVVSEEVAGAMAEGAAHTVNLMNANVSSGTVIETTPDDALGAYVAVSTTGVAGPGGGSETNPVGTVCFGFYLCGKTITETKHFEGDRQQVRRDATKYALEKVFELLN